MDNDQKKAILRTLRSAIQRETEAFNYYQKAKQKSMIPETASLLGQLAEEERRHRYFLHREINKILRMARQKDGKKPSAPEKAGYPIPAKPDFRRIYSIPAVDLCAVSLPSTLIGGDYLETLEIRTKNERALGLFVFDVMGHGMEATNLKAGTRRLFGQLCENWERGIPEVDMTQPHRVMQKINQDLMAECMSCARFITALYMVIFPDSKKAVYASAGHDPPILVNRLGYQNITDTELVLGADPSVRYHAFEIPIDTGDVLVFFTDGIIEAIDAEENMLERDGLTRWIVESREMTSQEIIENIFRRLAEFLEKSPIHDDFTLAVGRITARDR